MTNRQFIKTAVLVTGVISLVAASLAIVKVRAQIAIIQPFEAIQVGEMTPRKDQPPTPITYFQTMAVRFDGSVSRVTSWELRPKRIGYSREVIDATNKTHTFVDEITKTLVVDQYSDLQVLKAGELCEGKSVDPIQGFDIVYAEHAMPGPPGIDDGALLTHKEWKAPRLGCYPIVEEWVGTIQGLPVDTKHTLASIKLGEPDPWYFDTPTNYTVRPNSEWMALLKPLLKQ